jgi:FAD:protein FMN transferase
MKSSQESPSAGIAVEKIDVHSGVLRLAHGAMATIFEIYCFCDDETYARQAGGAAFSLVDRLEQELSRFIENSDVSRINALAPGESARVSPWTMECLLIARMAYQETGGAFDISIGTGFEALEWDADNFVVTARTGGVQLDLGGIGKGYAVDRVAELLTEWDIQSALVHGGQSSVLAMDPPPNSSGWSLSFSAPRKKKDAAFVTFSACRQAFSGSGIQKTNHIIDPRTREPVRSRSAAWVGGSLEVFSEFCCAAGIRNPEDTGWSRSPAAVAEGLSTAMMILSHEEIEDYCRKHPGLEVWLLDVDLLQVGGHPLFVHYPRHDKPCPNEIRIKH